MLGKYSKIIHTEMININILHIKLFLTERYCSHWHFKKKPSYTHRHPDLLM